MDSTSFGAKEFKFARTRIQCAILKELGNELSTANRTFEAKRRLNQNNLSFSQLITKTYSGSKKAAFQASEKKVFVYIYI